MRESTTHLCIITEDPLALAWHPLHPVLVSGGSEGAVLHWDLSAAATPEPSAGPSITPVQPAPRATLSQAHDSNVWSMQYHPLGHILVTASNDHTTRFWCRERPGDASSVFSGGGEKPPEASGQDEDEDVFMPGLGGGAWDDGAGANGQDAYSRDQEESIPGFGGGAPDAIPGFDTDNMPGLGAGTPGRQNGSGGNGGMYGRPDGDDQWGRGGGGGRGESRGGGGGGYGDGRGGGYSQNDGRGGGGYNQGGGGYRDGGGHDGGGRGGRGGRWGQRRQRY